MQQSPSWSSREGSVCMCCYMLYNKLHLSLTLFLFLCSSSEPVWRAGERGCQVCGGDSSETDTNTVGLWGKMKNVEEGGRGWRRTDGLREKQMRGKMCLREQSSSTGPWGQGTDGWMMEGKTGKMNREIERQSAHKQALAVWWQIRVGWRNRLMESHRRDRWRENRSHRGWKKKSHPVFLLVSANTEVSEGSEGQSEQHQKL